jgi:hypothetical protein
MQLATLCRCLVALCLVGHAFASVGTFTYYGDSSCATPLNGTTVNGAPNPLIAAVNDCILVYNVSGTLFWMKMTECSSTTALRTIHTDSSCITLVNPQPAGNPYPVGTCLTTNLPPGVTSSKVSCAIRTFFFPKSSAASAVLSALFVAVAALVTLCI